MRRTYALFLAVLTACAGGRNAPAPAAAPAPVPTDGHQVLARMFGAYEGRWYRSLTFVQNTVFNRPNAPPDTQTWYEAVKGADRLRIDIAPLSAGNGVIYKGDSSIVVRNGAVVRRLQRGNPFLPLIQGVYVQPVAETERQLAEFRFDLSRLHRATWDGRPAYVVGAASPADTTSPQFWVDAERWVLLRMIVALGQGPVVEARLSRYVELPGPSWLATWIDIINGTTLQTEEYRDWRINVDLPDALFDGDQWRTAPHWAAGRP